MRFLRRHQPHTVCPVNNGRLTDISDIQHGVTEQLKATWLQDFQRVFEDLHKRSQGCVEFGGDYIESL